MIGLYIHVPFCKSKCPYCDFYSVSAIEEIKDKYTFAVIDELKSKSMKLNKIADTLYFGGGTPTLLGAKRLSQITKAAVKYFNIPNGSEITVEMNPFLGGNFDFETLLNSGVNRLSVGMQSADDYELSLLGRTHTVNDTFKTIKNAKNAGFENISVDMMIGIRGQTENSIKKTIDFCKQNDVSHVSAYLLKIESGTEFYKLKDKLAFPDDDKQSDFYLLTCDYLEKNWFKQYEISNFALNKKESKHNLKYWFSEEYLGIGPSAHSFINKKRFFCPRDVSSFIKHPEYIDEQDGDVLSGSYLEYCMLRLRTSYGLNSDDFFKKFNFDLPQEFFERAKKLQNLGYVNLTKNSISFTKKGFLISNRLISEILF